LCFPLRNNSAYISLRILFFISTLIKVDTLRWAGHVIRTGNEEIVKRIMLIKPKGKLKEGRPRMRWMDVVEKDLRNLGMVNWKQRHESGMAGEKF
jgi:hypothetical protein